MALEIVPYKAEHALEIIKSKAKETILKLGEKAEERAKYLETAGPAITGLWNGTLLASGGLMFNGPWPGVAEAWCLFRQETDQTDVWSRMLFARKCKGLLYEWIEKYQLVRIEANLYAEQIPNIEFVKFLGLEFESLKPKYYFGGKTAVMYVKIVERSDGRRDKEE